MFATIPVILIYALLLGAMSFTICYSDGTQLKLKGWVEGFQEFFGLI